MRAARNARASRPQPPTAAARLPARRGKKDNTRGLHSCVPPSPGSSSPPDSDPSKPSSFERYARMITVLPSLSSWPVSCLQFSHSNCDEALPSAAPYAART